ncbi:pectinesterase family protein [Lapidilactobacillus bayanensis]|uniref:pectinesterase family protein n=1 Tax=Lapidilactobacillus bayanensis TaxID=2485998 RepID=UPI000F7A106A|nr:pectinesterase family protein [Lapidilactobacillus bayanensis]
MDEFHEEKLVTLVVAKNQANCYSTIQGAIDAAQQLPECAIEIIILTGDYPEKITLYRNNIRLVGVGQVRIHHHLYARRTGSGGEELGTFRTATFFVNAANVLLENLTIVNSAGNNTEKIGQAIAFYGEGNNITLQNCVIEGHQDTICLGPLPDLQKNGTPFITEQINQVYLVQNYQFNHCQISGTVDFIFGGGQAVFNNCQLVALAREEAGEVDYLTAASSASGSQGFIFKRCDIKSAQKQRYFLGRPWREHAVTIFEHCLFDINLANAGWHDWNKKSNRQTVHYQERQCFYEQTTVQRPNWVDFIREGLDDE